IAAAFELPPPTDWEQHDFLTAQLRERDRLQALASATLDAEYSTNDLHESLLAISRDYRQRLGVSIRGAERRAAKRRAKTLVGLLPRAERVDTLEAAHSLRAAWIGQPNYTAAANWTDTAPLIATYRADLASLDKFLQRMSLSDSPLADLPAHFVSLAKDPRRRVMPRAHASCDSLVSAGLGAIIAELESRNDISAATPDRAGQVFDRIVSSSLLDEALLFDADLATVSGEELNRTTSMFQRNDLGHLEANAVRIRRMAAERLKIALDANPEQHVLLKKEVTRKSRFTPVRGLLREIPEVILAAKPIWAMSPLQVSRLLPRTELFDLVIFDEASQVKPADAIPAILRGRQLIVAGDSRQLPPTEFFAKTLGDMDDDDEPEEDASLEVAVGEEPVRPSIGSLTRDAESILFAMDRLLAGQSRRLLWHYRSRDERLIAVSNRFVYDSALTTFPAADTPDAITHIEVPFSPGIGGGTNSPEAEVAAVVEAVKTHARLHPDESLGVIAFGIKHQNRLETALEHAFAEDPELFIKLNTKEPFFVKSIERVQGDERDAIILTVGYGKSDDGQLRLFWGPLLQTGGDRRLNVAISRARLRLSLVSSFSANDLAEDGHSSRGYKLMYQFVKFVASAGTEVAGLASRTVELDAFEANVRDRLEAAGLVVDCQVGVGSYRIDFAVRHPSKPGVHVLAIEIDGSAYNSGHTARERDRLRQQLLERRGWVFHRIWSTDWFSDPDSAVATAVAAFDAAVERLDAKTADATDETVVAWELPVGLRHGPRPEVTVGAEIDDYSTPELMEMVRWVRSDDVVRSSDDEITVVMRELGFERRGPKILRRIMDAQIRLGGVA
ncbi:MAG TPA: AAA domain-containing protein, partial [Glaciihabitans sp.]|nr:AAA domain-containing protein [Glaciihabitans sp.]